MDKLYFSISEVSKMLGLKQYVLRYWETEFTQLRPDKNRAGNRIYKSKDIETLKQIQDLLHTQKFTIKGAQNYLKQHKKAKKSAKSQAVPVIDATQMNGSDNLKTLKKIRQGLGDLLQTLDKYK